MAVKLSNTYCPRSHVSSRPAVSTNSATKASSASRNTSSRPNTSVSRSSSTGVSNNSNRSSTMVRQSSPAIISNVNTSVNSSQSAINSKSQITKGVGIGVNQNPLAYSRFVVDPAVSITKPQGASVLKISDNSLGRINSSGNPVGDWVFRVDNPHGNLNTYHMNTNPKIPQYYTEGSIYAKLDHKPISSTSYKAAGNISKISKATKVGGKALCVVALASDANDIYNSIKGDGYTVGKNTIKTSSGVAGSWAGGIGGAKAGAAVGSAIGTLICPGLGTAIGGAIGGIVGGIGGSMGGRALGERAATAFMR